MGVARDRLPSETAHQWTAGLRTETTASGAERGVTPGREIHAIPGPVGDLRPRRGRLLREVAVGLLWVEEEAEAALFRRISPTLTLRRPS